MSLLETRRDGDLLWITLNDPERANALSPALIGELIELYRRPWRAEGVRCLLLSGAGRNFSAGADLEHLRSLRDAGPEDILHDSLGGGGTESLKNDAQGKTHAQGLLQMEVDVPEGLAGAQT
jgi:enoyl-CoA hydratase/carnithine racemase